MTDGIKLIRINVEDSLLESVLEQRYVEQGGDPVVIPAMHRVSDQASDVIEARRDWNDYFPWQAGGLALLALGFMFYSFRRRDEEKATRWSEAANYLGWVLAIAAGVASVRAVDSSTHLLTLPEENICDQVFTAEGLQEIREDETKSWMRQGLDRAHDWIR